MTPALIMCASADAACSQHWVLPETTNKHASVSAGVGLSRRAHTKHASMATLAGLARIRRRVASARKSLARQFPPKQFPPKLETAGSQVSGEFGGKGLALEVCRPNDAVLQSWDAKVFPGEGVGCETVRDNTFTGRHSLANILTFGLPCSWF